MISKQTLLYTLNLLIGTELSAKWLQKDTQNRTPLLAPKREEFIQADTSEFELSFLNVSPNCKVSHAAFDEVKVGLESISKEVIAIHAQIEST